jgi:hypothetical protein
MDICIIFLLLIVVSATGELVPDEPQRRLNASLEQADLATALFARNTSSPLAKRSTCRTGYSACDYDASRCCVTGYTCCSTGWCAAPGYVCCGAGACPSNWQCCGAINTCAPIGGECCSGGLYCLPGKQCRLWNGKRVCCPSSGCAGESSNGDLTSSLLATMSTVSATAGLTEISGR